MEEYCKNLNNFKKKYFSFFLSLKNILSRMNSLFILNINNNPFLSQVENYMEKLSELCPSLEIIDDVRLIFLVEVMISIFIVKE